MSKVKKTIIICCASALLLSVLSVCIYFVADFLNGELGYPLILEFRDYDRVDYRVVEAAPEDTNLHFLNVRARNQLAEYMKENDLLIEPNNYGGNILRTSPFEDLLDVLVFIKDPNAKT